MSAWIGFSLNFCTLSKENQPVYCDQVIQDVLEFAMCDLAITSFYLHNVPAECITKIHQPLPFSATKNILYANGLISADTFMNPELPLSQVVCATPFTSTKVGLCHLITKELCPMYDEFLPALYEKHLDSAYRPHVSINNPLFLTILSKILLHTL